MDLMPYLLKRPAASSSYTPQTVPDLIYSDLINFLLNSTLFPEIVFLCIFP